MTESFVADVVDAVASVPAAGRSAVLPSPMPVVALPPAAGASVQVLKVAPPLRAWSAAWSSHLTPLALAGLMWAALLGVGLAFRPVMPMDETRYLTIAWEMWTGGDHLVPHLNGQPYAHKGPLLFWLVNAAWMVTGVCDWSARLVSPLFGLGCLLLTSRLGAMLWPDLPHVRRYAPLVLAGGAFWSVFSTLTYFDTLVTFFSLLGACGIVQAWRGNAWLGWLQLAPAIGLGLLTKGPVILVHLAPIALLAPWWTRGSAQGQLRGARWLAGITACLAVGIAMALAWALPAARAGGAEYEHSIFLGQTADRVVSSFAHPQPFYWYLLVLPVMLFPWAFWVPLWRTAVVALRGTWSRAPVPARDAGVIEMMREPGVRACLCWVGCVLGILSLVSGKLPHYLMPILPACSLLMARALPLCRIDRPRLAQLPVALTLMLVGAVAAALAIIDPPAFPDWVHRIPASAGTSLFVVGGVLLVFRFSDPFAWVIAATVAMAAVVMSAHATTSRGVRTAYDLAPMAERIAACEHAGIKVSFLGLYHGEYTYLARLAKPLPRIEWREARRWVFAHPGEAFVAVYRDEAMTALGDPSFIQDFRGKNRVGLWYADEVRANALAHPPLDLGPGYIFDRDAALDTGRRTDAEQP